MGLTIIFHEHISVTGMIAVAPNWIIPANAFSVVAVTCKTLQLGPQQYFVTFSGSSLSLNVCGNVLFHLSVSRNQGIICHPASIGYFIATALF